MPQTLEPAVAWDVRWVSLLLDGAQREVVAGGVLEQGLALSCFEWDPVPLWQLTDGTKVSQHD